MVNSVEFLTQLIMLVRKWMSQNLDSMIQRRFVRLWTSVGVEVHGIEEHKAHEETLKLGKGTHIL